MSGEHDRRIRRSGSKSETGVRRAVVGVRRAVRRFQPFLSSTGPGDALQASLLRRVDVREHNVASGPPNLGHVRSQTCSAAQVLDPRYAEWAAELQEVPRLHRKQWEYIVILEAARQAGVLRAGRSALGFGVGTEPLPALLASYGMSVLATDQPPASAGHWTERDEHAAGLAELDKPHLCNPSVFQRQARFRPVDMTDLPGDLGAHDLIWSACVIEHLGSPQAGLDFVVQSLGLLKPGGVAIHTTELELTTRATTADYGHCAVYRLPDLLALQTSVRAAGFEMELNPYVALEHEADRYIAPPLSVGTERFHLKLALYDSITTSISLVIRRPASAT